MQIRKLIIALLLIAASVLATGQATQEDALLLSLARTATNVAANTLHKNMAGYMAVYIDDKSWEKLSKDSDFGPVLKLREPKPGRSMVLVMSLDNAAARVAVYFEGMDAAGSVIVLPQSDTKLEPSAVKPVPKEALKEIDAEQGLLFMRGEVSSDDGDPVVTYQITSSEKKSKN
ncbi:MAG TPA: hypothetical protein VNW97_05225 [Candidatus Saccharimonadales bacterium]|jgi:hypothetical protein|nr:hypothetical protein [Candidatus Saccharimonadales bacterium]